jgi:tetratricopeptide (TPR) repeat protein
VTVEHPGAATFAWKNALLNLHILTLYVSLFVAPISLSLVHDVTEVTSALDIRVIVGAAVLAALLWLAAGWRRREPLITFGIAWFLLVLIPSAALIVVADKGQPMAEHRVYLASCGLFLAVAAAWVQVVQYLTLNVRRPIAVGAVIVAVAGLGTLTVVRNGVWSDPVRLWQDAARKAPRTYMAQYGVGESFRAAGDCEAAVPAYQRAIRLRPTLEDGYLGLAECLIVNERPDDAMQVFRAAVKRASTAVKSRLNLASFEAERGNAGEALRLCREVLAVAPNDRNAAACIQRNVAAASSGQ